jgi:GMP synthase (glutamine-hydrolysing)
MFLDRLEGVVDPEKKRKIIGNTFIEVFVKEAERIELELEGKGKIEFLLQVFRLNLPKRELFTRM